MSDRLSVTEALIQSGNQMRIVPQGTSMLPLLDGEKDSVVVVSLCSPPKKFSLVLYRDNQDALVVHRVVNVYVETQTCALLGDGNIALERDVPFSHICGVVTRICRHGCEFSVKHPVYLLYVILWHMACKYRRHLLRRLFGTRRKNNAKL